MDCYHVSVDFGKPIERFDAFWTLVLKSPLVPITMEFESPSVLEGFIASMACKGVEVKERLILNKLQRR